MRIVQEDTVMTRGIGTKLKAILENTLKWNSVMGYVPIAPKNFIQNSISMNEYKRYG